MRFAFLGSCVVMGVVTLVILKTVFDKTLLFSVIAGIAVALAEWSLLSFVFRKVYGVGLSNFDDLG